MLAHLVLVAACAALWTAGWSFASGLAGVERVVGAAVVVGALAVGSALLLGVVGFGGNALALLSAAVAAAALSHGIALREGADRRGARWSLWLGAAAGAGVAWVGWVFRHPALGIDPLSYHLPEAIRWVQHGSVGAVETVQYDFPTGAYPVTNEVIVAWLLGLGRSLAPALVWTPLCGALLCAALWVGLRRLGVSGWGAAGAAACVLLVPIGATQHLGPHTDLPALAWACCAFALLVVAVQERQHRERVFGLAVVAAGLAIGTKTTVAPLLVLAVGWVAWRLRPGWRAGAPALAVAVGVGGVWYLRNLVLHGSPLWPFLAAPWGDDVPPGLAAFDTSFLDRPGASLEGRTGAYYDLLAGGLVVLAAAFVAAAVERRRPVVVAAGACALALFAWLSAPFTGAAEDVAFDLSLTTTRYLMPAVCAGAVCVALAGRWGAVVLWAAAALSLERALALPFPGVPSLVTLLLGAVVGLALTAALRGARSVTVAFRGHISVLATVTVVAGALTLGVGGLAERHAKTARLPSAGVIAWLAAQPGFEEGDEPVAFAPQMLAVLAGPHLEHPIELIPRSEPCARTLARDGYIVLGTFPLADRRARFSAAECLAERPAAYEDAFFKVFRGPLQTATRSKASSTSSPESRKSSGAMSAARGSGAPTRLRVRSRS